MLEPTKGICTNAEVGSMPKGMQSPVSKQEIEAKGKDDPDGDFYSQILIKANGFNPEWQAQQDNSEHNNLWGDPFVTSGTDLGKCGHAQFSSALFLPKRPRALKPTTRISKIYMDIIDHAEA